MLWLSDNIPLCECPEWGMNGTRCTHIGFKMKDGYAGPLLCLKYGEVELKSTSQGWLIRCKTCANGGYEARSEESVKLAVKQFQPAPTNKPKPRKKKFLTHADLRELPLGLPYQELLVEMLKRARGPVTKTDLLELASSRNWHGYVDGSFVSAEKQLRIAFDTLVFDGFIIYEKGKPLKLREE